MSVGGRKLSTSSAQQQQQNGRRTKQGTAAIVNNKLLSSTSSANTSFDIELFGAISTTNDLATMAAGQKNGLPVAAGGGGGAAGGTTNNKAAMQKLASSFVALNKRKAEKRKSEQTSWMTLIQSALDLQKGKIPLLLAVEAGNQSMCRELLSSQTADQLKVSSDISVTKYIHFLNY